MLLLFFTPYPGRGPRSAPLVVRVQPLNDDEELFLACF